jgi:hypothetical protein
MPTSVQAALVFSAIIVPGFLFVRGFGRGRPRITQEQPLYVLAQAVVASLFLLAIAWWLGGRTVVGWLRDSTAISKHRDGTYGFFLGLLLVPFPLGLLAGGIADWLLARVLDARDRLASARALEPDARRRRRSLAIWLLRGIESRELLEGSATWDRMWRQLQRRNKYLYVRIRTKTGYEITGEVGDDSRVALSPQVQDLYVERVYRPIDAARPNGEMAPVEAGRGIYIRGSEIETVEFRGPAATIPAATSRSATT